MRLLAPAPFLAFLVLMKLEASRSIDLGDVSRILGSADASRLDETRAVFRHRAPELVADLESFITLGKLEMDSP